MAQLRAGNLIAPFAIGVVSAGGELVEMNHRADGGDNVFMKNAGLVADVSVGAYGFLNHMMDLNFPRNGSLEALGGGLSILTRRLSHLLGTNVLGLTAGTPIKTPGRLGSGRHTSHRLNPGAAIETDPRSRKRQFFSVT